MSMDSNYQHLFASSSFRKAVSNMVMFTLVSVPLVVACSLFIAMLLNHNVYLRNWLRTAYVMPLVVPTASIILVWQVLFDWNGTLNAILHSLQHLAYFCFVSSCSIFLTRISKAQN